MKLNARTQTRSALLVFMCSPRVRLPLACKIREVGEKSPLHSSGLVPEANELMPTPMLMYRSGEEIKKGDHVRFHGNPAEVELVATDPKDPEQAWHVQEFGGGVLISDPVVSGRTFIPRDQLAEYEDLEFVSRAR